MSFEVVAVIYLVIMFAFFITTGIVARRKIKSQAAYLAGGRSFGSVSNGLAGSATLMSEFLFVGMTGAVVATGFGYTGILFVFAIGAALGALLIVPYLRRSEAFSIVGVLSIRYGRPAFWLALAVNFLFAAMFLLGQMKAAAVTLQFLVPGSEYLPALILAGVFITVYTVIGGLYGVTYNQVMQGILLLLAILIPLSLILRAQDVANWLNPLLSYSALSGALEQKGFYTLKQPGIYFASMIIPGIGLMVGPHAFVISSRAKSSNTVRWSVAWMLVFIAVVYGGAMGYAFSSYYWIATTGTQVSPDYTLFKMAQLYLSPWVSAFLIVTGFGSAVSTVGGILMFYGAAISKDVLDLVRQSTEKEKLVASYAATALAAVFGVLVAANPPMLLATPIIAGWELLSVVLIPPVVLGLWWKRAHPWGVYASIPITAVLTLLTQVWTGPAIKLPYFGGLLTFPLAFLIIIGVSLVAPKQSKEQEVWVDKVHGWQTSSEERYNGNLLPAVLVVVSLAMIAWGISAIA